MRGLDGRCATTVVVMGTMDTKGTEMAYLAEVIREAGCAALLMDVGTHRQSSIPADVSASAVAAAVGEDINSPRGEAVSKMSQAAAQYLNRMLAEHHLDGVVGLAHEMDIFTMAYVFCAEEARQMAAVGCDVLIAHVGLTSGGSIGAAQTVSLTEAAAIICEIREAAREVNPDMILLCHGGPIAMPEDAREILKLVPVQGFVSASSIERLPVENGIRDAVAAFAVIPLRM